MLNKRVTDKTKKWTAQERRNKSTAAEFIDFVVMFNRFINHRPKDKVPMMAKDMRI